MGLDSDLGPRSYEESKHLADSQKDGAPKVAAGRTSGVSTGIATVDQQLCKAHPTRKGCFLDANDRTEVVSVLRGNVHTAMMNANAALTNLRMELLTAMTTKSAWGGFAELLFMSATSGLIKLVSGSVSSFQASVAEKAASAAYTGGTVTIGSFELSERMLDRIAAVNPTKIAGGLTTASKGLRTSLKNAAHSLDDSNKRDADFLKIVQSEIGPMTNTLCNKVPAGLTDAELVTMTHAYEDMTFHSLAAYEDEFRNLLDRYREQKIDDIGQSRISHGNAYKELVHVVKKDGVSRTAIVEFYDKNPSQPVKGYEGKVVPFEQTQFVSWVDDDLYPIAVTYQQDRRGDTKTIDATKPTGMKEIDAWGAEK
jgi:hypothetical protein